MNETNEAQPSWLSLMENEGEEFKEKNHARTIAFDQRIKKNGRMEEFLLISLKNNSLIVGHSASG